MSRALWPTRMPDSALLSEPTDPFRLLHPQSAGAPRFAPDRYCSGPPQRTMFERFLQHLVGGRDDAGAGRIGLLRHDQLGELLGDVGVGRFERGADDAAAVVEHRLARLRGRREHAAIQALELVDGVEVRRHHLRHVELLAVVVGDHDAAVVVDGDRDELARGIAVLVQRRDFGRAVGIGELGEAVGAVLQPHVADGHAVDGEACEVGVVDRPGWASHRRRRCSRRRHAVHIGWCRWPARWSG